MAKLADALDLGSSGRPWGFKSLHPHHVGSTPFFLVLLVAKLYLWATAHISPITHKCLWGPSSQLDLLANCLRNYCLFDLLLLFPLSTLWVLGESYSLLLSFLIVLIVAKLNFQAYFAVSHCTQIFLDIVLTPFFAKLFDKFGFL